MITNSEMGDKIRSARKAAKLSQSELADLTNTSRISIGNYERGDRTPKIDVASRIANALKIPLSELIDTTEIGIEDIIQSEELRNALPLSEEFKDPEKLLDTLQKIPLNAAGSLEKIQETAQHLKALGFNPKNLLEAEKILRIITSVIEYTNYLKQQNKSVSQGDEENGGT